MRQGQRLRKAAGAEPLCYESDVTDEIVERYRKRHQATERVVMTFRQTVLVGLLPMICIAPVVADMITPSHTCPKPIRVSQFASPEEQAKFNRQVTIYKQCLSDFINEQNKEARTHSEAARNAVNELKRFGL